MPMKAPAKTYIKSRPFQLYSKTTLQVLVLLTLCRLGTILHAQTLEIKLVNGRNGHPIGSTCLYVWVGDRSNPNAGPLLDTETDKDGFAVLTLADGHAGEIKNPTQQLVCGLPGVVKPTVKYGDTIRVRAGYVLCQPHAPDYSWLAATDFSTKEVLQHGIVTGNNCGKAVASLKPGQLIMFVRPLSWWEKMKQ